MAADTAYTVASDSEVTGELYPDRSISSVETAVGIDVGTSRSSIAIWRDGIVELFPGALGQKRLLSHILFRADAAAGVSSLGAATDEELWSGKAIFNMRRLIGRMDTDPVIRRSMHYPFLLQSLDIGVRPLLAALTNNVWRSTNPEEVMAMALMELRAMAELHLGRVIRSSVITIPVSFSRFQQTRLERACAMAGFSMTRLMPEPTAVALVYAQLQMQATQGNMGSGMEKLALIFSMGGGFCDVAITATAGGVSQIKGLAGEVIGGDDLLQNMVNHLAAELHPQLMKHQRAPSEMIKLAGLLRAAAEKAIHILSTQTSTQLDLDLGGGEIFSRTITKAWFEEINAEILQKVKQLVSQCLKDAEIDPRYIADLVLVGGCSRIPSIRALLQEICPESEIFKGIDPLEAAVRGVALEGAITSGLTDPLGSLDLLTIQAMPQSVGIGLAGGKFQPILQRNSTIPARRDVTVTTSHENQPEALVVVYEGEGKDVKDNHLLGFFKLAGIPPAPGGVPLISVCMDVNASNVLTVLAGVSMPNSDTPAVLLREVRMPTLDDGHGWCIEAIAKKHRETLDVVLPSQPSG
ncbi:hypothetical protein O6H91_07G037500 [Diphasiastrum complanatum]|uniref:Uncharacterized protein n=1 Tax=Diphasiastrum complanatum TaxID=34168 RepID=A0ACC2D4G3_DIPCM|nr:hypothetical protein O6H91_07G037500 [Diphasiastrum complanatum]